VLKDKLQAVLDENIIRGGEYQINDGIEKMKQDGAIFKPGQVDEWMDCGNKNVTVETNSRMLHFIKKEREETLVNPKHTNENSTIIPPCYIGENVVLKNSKIGPNVSVGKGSIIENSEISDTLIQEEAEVKNAKLTNSMIGNYAKFNGDFTSISIGDYSVLE
jgi:glucose-1-phosphate thymidylyltransferase